MQPTELQVQRSLEALLSESQPDAWPAVEGVGSVDLPDGLLDLLRDVTPIRLDRMVDAKMRLSTGRRPSDDDLADRLVGRLVCDRLR